MMIRLTIFILTLFISLNSIAQELSSTAKISILTIAPGHEELFAAFGHSAIRVRDPENRIDKIYNYGTYYYNQPYFYLNFARGYLLYGLSVTSYQRFKGYYAYYNRQIKAQYLNLSFEQTQAVYNYLENNARPENKMYYYDYYFNNCATQIRDVFIEVLGNDFKIPQHYVKIPGKSLRLLQDDYIQQEFPWGKLGIDLCLGLPIDKVASDYEYMYLPDYLYEGFKVAEIKNETGWELSVADEKVILPSRSMDYPMPWFTPSIAFSLVLLVGILFFGLQLKKGWRFRWFDFIVFFFIGSVGVLLFLLWVATDHNAAANNFNLLWALPVHLLVSFAILRKNTKRWVNWYLALLIPFSILLVVFWKVIPQDLNEGFIPIVFLIVVRSLAIIIRK
jgi:uncharacterized protein DUF4105